jgi:hypothetical protein
VSDVPEELARYAPSPHAKDVEAVLSKHTARRAVWVAPVLALVFFLFRGLGGAAASVMGVAIVAGNFVLSGVVMSRSARISLSLYHAAALFGFFLRLGLIMVTMFLIAAVFEIDRLALGVSVVVSYLVLLSWEALSVAKGAEKELEWT